MTDRRAPGIDDLRRLAVAYGADPNRWPEEARREMERLGPGHEELALDLRNERMLDELLDSAILYEPSADLAAEILLLGRRRKLPWWLASCLPIPAVWRPATILTIALLIGIAFGVIYRSGSTTDYLDFEIDELLLGYGK